MSQSSQPPDDAEHPDVLEQVQIDVREHSDKIDKLRRDVDQLRQQNMNLQPIRDVRVRDIGPIHIENISTTGCCKGLALNGNCRRRKRSDTHDSDDDDDGDNHPKRQKTPTPDVQADESAKQEAQNLDQTDLAHAMQAIADRWMQTRVPDVQGSNNDNNVAWDSLQNKMAAVVAVAQGRSDRATIVLEATLDNMPRVRLPEIGEGSIFRGQYRWGFDREVPDCPGSWQYASEGEEGSAQGLASMNLSQILGPNPSAEQVHKLRRDRGERADGVGGVTEGVDIIWVPDGCGHFPNPRLTADVQQQMPGLGVGGNPSRNPGDQDGDRSVKFRLMKVEGSDDDELVPITDGSTTGIDPTAGAGDNALTIGINEERGSTTNNAGVPDEQPDPDPMHAPEVNTEDNRPAPSALGDTDDNDHEQPSQPGAGRGSDPSRQEKQHREDPGVSKPTQTADKTTSERKGNWTGYDNMKEGEHLGTKSFSLDIRPEDNQSAIIEPPPGNRRLTRQSLVPSTGGGPMGPPPPNASSKKAQTRRRTSTPATTTMPAHESSIPKPAGNKHAHANNPRSGRRDSKVAKQRAIVDALSKKETARKQREAMEREDGQLEAIDEGDKEGNNKSTNEKAAVVQPGFNAINKPARQRASALNPDDMFPNLGDYPTPSKSRTGKSVSSQVGKLRLNTLPSGDAKPQKEAKGNDDDDNDDDEESNSESDAEDIRVLDKNRKNAGGRRQPAKKKSKR